MFDKPQASHTLGLELDGSSLKGVALSYVRTKPKLEAFFDYIAQPTDPTEENVKPLYTADQQSHLNKLIQKNLVVTAMNAQEVLVRSVELKVKKEKDIDSVLAFQAEPILPYPPENAILDKILLSHDPNGSKITLLAVRKDHLEQHLKTWNDLEIEPEVITATPAALALFAKNFSDTPDLSYVLHLGWTQSLGILSEKGKLIAAQTIPQGIKELAEALAQEKGIPITSLRQQLNDSSLALLLDTPASKNALTSLRAAITRTVYSLAKQIKGKEVSNLLVTGIGATLPGLSENISRSLNKPLLPLHEDPEFGMDTQELQTYALPIGQALSALPTSKDPVNFRQEDFVFPNPWKRLKQPIAIYLGLCCGIALALFLFGKAYIHYQENHVKHQYLELLSVMNRPYLDFEKEFTTKIPSTRELAPGEVIPVASLTPEEIQARLQYLEKEIQAIPQTYPLLPNIPLVSDVLAWITHHPSFVGKSKDGKDPSLQIESFNYALVKRPEPTKKQEKYQVKVEMEFSSPTPKQAREFHDALIAPNDMVDPKAEIKWNSNRDRYRTSFYLKDKTIYPAP